MADRDDLTPESDPSTAEVGDVAGENLVSDDLTDPGGYEISADETEAEELEAGTDEALDADVVDDEEQLSEAEVVAAAARDTRPVRKVRPTAEAPAKKGHATPKRSSKQTAQESKRTNPVQFTREAAGELRKVVWPTASQLQQYFIVVLVFVLVIIAYVSVLDLAFGWGLLKIFG